MKVLQFKRVGWLCLPVSVPDAVIALAALAFCGQLFLAGDHKSHPVSDTLCGVLPFFICAFLLFDWIAARTSDK